MSRNRTITICGLLLVTFALAPSLTAQLGHKKDYVYAGPRVLAVESQGCITETAACDVGIGTPSPGSPLHVVNNGPTNLRLENTSAGGKEWSINSANNGNLIVLELGEFMDNSIVAFKLTPTGALTLSGVCDDSDGGDPDGTDGCDAVFQPGYNLESIEEHAASMWENSHLRAIGPTPEGKRISLNIQKRHFGVLNELEKAHIYIDQLNERLKQKEAEVTDLRRESAEFENRLARLESLLSNDRR